jgi:arginase family enzyme
MFSLPQLIGIPFDASSSFLRGAAAAPPLIRAAMASPAGNSFTESGADLTGLADAGDLALGEDGAAARATIQAGITAMLENGFRPIGLGGDHSISYPIMRAIASRSSTSTRTPISMTSTKATAIRTPAHSRASWQKTCAGGWCKSASAR